METLTFRPESFELEYEAPPSGGCGCSQCRQSEYEAPSKGGCGCTQCRQNETDDSELDEGEFDDHEVDESDEYEWESNPRAKCSADAPSEVDACGSEREAKPIQCAPGFAKMCPALPETWKSTTIAGVKFFYKPKLNGRHDVVADGENKHVNLYPPTWRAAQSWVASMNGVFNMRIAAVYHAGAGRYCRCVRKGATCKESKPELWHTCQGTNISNHGFGDALDIIGVKWADPKAVGSNKPTTVIHDWQDANQAALLIRINAALRLVFRNVYDWSREDHRDHFHCDMNRSGGGGNTKLLGEICGQNFIMSSLKRLGYLTTAKPTNDWSRARTALADFAQVNNMPVPTSSDREPWRPVVHRLFACVALGIPGACAKR